jgi:hypothetical protein
VWTTAADGSDAAEVHRSSGAGLIYMSWAPDNRQLAVLMQEARMLVLRVLDSRGLRPPVVVAQGGPIYYAWCPDSKGLIANVGPGPAGRLAPDLAWLRVDGDRVERSPVRAVPAGGFRAPVWSAVLGAATMAVARGEGAEIVSQVGADQPLQSLCETGISPAFGWSPSGELIAVTARREGRAPLYDGLSIVERATGTLRRLTDDPLLAFFWCPRSDRIVYAGGEVGDRLVQLRAVEVGSGRKTDLGWLRPARDVWLLFNHFDQYKQSTQLVSPDGTEVVVAASRAQERENGHVPTVRHVLLLPVDGSESPRVVGSGRLACWRPGR